MNKINSQSGIAPVVILIIVLVLAGAGGGIFYFRNKGTTVTTDLATPTPAQTSMPSASPEGTDVPKSVQEVKEFVMTSYYEVKDGKPSTHFSLTEIKVKKGDTVRIKVTNTNGSHDFSLDEYGIKEATPLNQEVIIEFTADKAGSFKYYCSVPGHRQLGQEGTLVVE